MVIFRVANKFFTNRFDAEGFSKWQKDNAVLTMASRDVFEVIVEEHPIVKPRCLYYHFNMAPWSECAWFRYSTESLGYWDKTDPKIKYDSNSRTYCFVCKAISLTRARKKADKIYKKWKQQQQPQN